MKIVKIFVTVVALALAISFVGCVAQINNTAQKITRPEAQREMFIISVRAVEDSAEVAIFRGEADIEIYRKTYPECKAGVKRCEFNIKIFPLNMHAVFTNDAFGMFLGLEETTYNVNLVGCIQDENTPSVKHGDCRFFL